VSPTEILFRRRLERRASQLSPELRQSILRAFNKLRASVSETQLEQIIRSQQIELIFEGPLSAQVLDQAFAASQKTLRNGVEQAAESVTRTLPASARGIAFNVLSPDVVVAIRELDTAVIGGLKDGVREVVRAYVEQGLRAGVNPREVARQLRSVIGLAPNQLSYVENFRQELLDGDLSALERTLLDKRSVGTIRKAFAGNGLSEGQIDKMTEAYRQSWIATNAETNARTAALDANRLAEHLGYKNAVDQGFLDGGTLTKRWSGVLDDRERESHVLMQGNTVPWDGNFSNGQFLPGDTEYNCRCIPIYETNGQVRPGDGDLSALVAA